MSRGFINEDDQEEVPILTPRADLPKGVTNYVTQAGWEELLAEQDMLTNEKNKIDGRDEDENRIATNHINAKLNLLTERISTAKIVDSEKQPQNEVRFGAFVSLKINNDKKIHHYQIVGVDEANLSKRKISFVSPIAKILSGKKKGEKATLKLAQEERVFEVVEISY